MRYTKAIDWFEMWDSDKKSILNTMYKNLNADLEAGYNPVGACITMQQAAIQEYINGYHADLDKMVYMSEEETSRFCFYDLKKRGAIE